MDSICRNVGNGGYMYVNMKKFYSEEIAIEWAVKNSITEYWFEHKESFVRLVWRQEEV